MIGELSVEAVSKGHCHILWSVLYSLQTKGCRVCYFVLLPLCSTAKRSSKHIIGLAKLANEKLKTKSQNT